MIFAIIAAWLAYKRAKENNRNGIAWALIVAGAFVGTQLVVSVGVGFLLGIGILIFGWSESVLEQSEIVATIIAVVASVGVTWLILRRLSKVPAEDFYAEPPQPPKFD